MTDHQRQDLVYHQLQKHQTCKFVFHGQHHKQNVFLRTPRGQLVRMKQIGVVRLLEYPISVSPQYDFCGSGGYSSEYAHMYSQKENKCEAF